MKRPPRSKLEQKIREHRLCEWQSVRQQAAAARDAERQLAFEAEKAEVQRVALIRADAERKAQALHAQLLEDGMRRRLAHLRLK